MVLVVGATGQLGGAAARLLLRQGRALRVLARSPAKVEPLRAAGAEVVEGDLLDRASLDRACCGVRQVFTTANSFLGKGPASPARVDGPGNRNLVDAARAAGVERFVFTSAHNVEAMAVVDYFRIKLDAESYVRASGMPYTILRPTSFMEIWGALLGEPVLATGSARIFGPGTRRSNYVAIDDVAAMAALVLDREDARGETIAFGGPDNLTALEVVEIFERIAGHGAKRTHVPIPVLKGMAAIVPLVNPVFGRQVKLGLLSQQIDGTFDMTEVLKRFPIPQTRLEDWARQRYGR